MGLQSSLLPASCGRGSLWLRFCDGLFHAAGSSALWAAGGKGVGLDQSLLSEGVHRSPGWALSATAEDAAQGAAGASGKINGTFVLLPWILLSKSESCLPLEEVDRGNNSYYWQIML